MKEVKLYDIFTPCQSPRLCSLGLENGSYQAYIFIFPPHFKRFLTFSIFLQRFYVYGFGNLSAKYWNTRVDTHVVKHLIDPGLLLFSV